MSRVVILAPLAGWCMPLAEVPDAVFAQGMAGDGLAIDPVEGLLRAPCDGELLPMRDAKHAVTVRAAGGVDLLVHVGIDSVELHGAGFERLVADARYVRTGDPLVRFDLDFLARRAKSLVSPIIVAAGGRIVRRAPGGRIATGEFLLEVEPAAAIDAAQAGAPSGGARSDDMAHAELRNFVIPFEHGLHARPAAQVAAALRPFSAQVRLAFRGREADARSPVAMMALGLRAGDAIDVHATGADAPAALAMLERWFSPPRDPVASAAPAPPPKGRIDATIASRGVAMGACARWERPEIAVAERGAGEKRESAALESALRTVVAHLESLMAQAQGEGHALLAAHVELARDPELHRRAAEGLGRGETAGYAWRRATRATANVLAALDDARMRERAADLLDLEHQVLRVLAGEPPAAAHTVPRGAIVIADELLPSQLMALQRAGAGGVCTARGGPTSHVAILAAAAGMPALVGAGAAVLAIRDGTRVVLDAEHGWLDVDPPEAQWTQAQRALEARRVEDAADSQASREPATTRDGVRIHVHANLGASAEAAPAVAHGADGCGLLRTEFLYLDRREAPAEEEQLHEYQAIGGALGGRCLTIRTMDIGGDKRLAFLPLPDEENPALGLRGVRASLEHPHLLRTQLAAILRVQPPGACRILVPMVTDVADVRFVRAILEEEMRRLGLGRSPLVGAMIETPASALLAAELARECDFLSLGTNDLAQYTLAIDRAHPRLAARLDALHPAVLRLIARVTEAASAQGRSVSVCGALGSDGDALPVLVGLGVHEISAVPSSIPRLKRLARELDTQACRELARRALELPTAAAVRDLVASTRAAHPALVPGG